MIIRGSGRSLINMSRPDILCHDKGTNLETDHQNQNKITSKSSKFSRFQLRCNFFTKAFYYQGNLFKVLLFHLVFVMNVQRVAPMVLRHIFLYSNILPLVILSFKVCSWRYGVRHPRCPVRFLKLLVITSCFLSKSTSCESNHYLVYVLKRFFWTSVHCVCWPAKAQ